jgi:tetratricopeptide (TPR) repeat protein
VRNNLLGCCAALYFSALFLGILVFSLFFVTKHLGVQPDSSFVAKYKPPQNNIPVAKEPWKTLSVSGIVKLRKMLLEERFDELNAALAEYQQDFEQYPLDEYKIFSACDTFYIKNPAYKTIFKKWLAATPDQYQPYLAAAEYYYALGWQSRGGAWAKETSNEQFRKMHAFFSVAEQYAETAIDKYERLAPAHGLLICIAELNHNDSVKEQRIRRSRVLFPYSFMLRSSYIWTEKPRWGGSYAAMARIAAEAASYVDKNPRLLALYGYIYRDQADLLERDDNYKEALKLLDKAIALGDVASFYRDRARFQISYFNRDDLALQDINRSIYLLDTNEESYRIRSQVYFAKGEYEKSFADLHTAELLSPKSSKIKKFQEWAAKKLVFKGYEQAKHDLQQAVELYTLALRFDVDNAETYYWRAVAFDKLNEREAAVADLKNAIRHNPRHFESYRMMDYLLAKEKDWNAIIQYWDKFIALEPDNAAAYFERSGTHYHNKNMKNAMSDLLKACELGSEPACKQYKSVAK